MTAAASHSELTADEIQRSRLDQYNATLTAILPVHSDLRILRVVPDAGLPVIEAGQFMTLGLGNWEPRVEGVDEEQIDGAHVRRLAKRAYSISCPLLDDQGLLRRASEFAYLEFYVALVRHGQKRPPSLTPRLFALEMGDRLFVERHAAGHYTLGSVQPDENVFFFATGTGEAPHNAMIAELLARGHGGQIVNVVSVRYLRDAAYRATHEELMRRYPRYHYYVLATRERRGDEPWNLPLGCRYHLQDLIVTGELERQSGFTLDPANTHVFLCGNSEMIGDQHGSSSSGVTVTTGSMQPGSVKPGGMLDLLTARGFRVGQAGNIHFERY